MRGPVAALPRRFSADEASTFVAEFFAGVDARTIKLTSRTIFSGVRVRLDLKPPMDPLAPRVRVQHDGAIPASANFIHAVPKSNIHFTLDDVALLRGLVVLF